MTPRYENQKIKQGYSYVIGCDEVGRGCLAGPVVAAAVVFGFKELPDWFGQINDSKKLQPKAREKLSRQIKANAVAWSIAEVAHNIVDEINIHNASLLAMRRAVKAVMAKTRGVIPSASEESLKHRASRIKGSLRSSDALVGRDDTLSMFLYVDGKFPVPNLLIDQEAVIAGDSKVLSIAAASIIAKVYRDGLMEKLHQTYPVYNLAQHKGYATEHHRKMIAENGLSPIHRLSFCSH